MMKIHILLLELALVACLPAYAASEQQDSCEYFFLALKSVPHDNLTRRDGAHRSLWDGKKYTGCEIKFETNNKLLAGRKTPDFDPTEDSEMDRGGWRVNNSFVADGPGTGLFGIEKESILCLVRHEQPAYLDDHGHIVQSETLTITIQCRQK
jgi:hypothetical protein